MTVDPSDRNGARTLHRGLRTLEAVSRHRDGVTLGELAKELAASKSTIHRFLTTLQRMGYVEQAADGEAYHLGVHVLSLAGALLDGQPLRVAASPELLALVRDTGESAILSVVESGEVLLLDVVDSPHALRMNMFVGMRQPVHSTAVGKAILAYVDEPTRAPFLRTPLAARTPRTITDPSELASHVLRVRASGFAVDDQEEIDGVRCVAAPVFGIDDSVVAAIGVSGPAHRLTADSVAVVARRVVDAAERVSARLGHDVRRQAAVG